MKKIILFLCFTFFISNLFAIELQISIDKTIFNHNESVIVNVTLLNNEDKEIIVPVRFIPQDHYIKFVIVNPEGKRCEFLGYDSGLKKDKTDLLTMPAKSKITIPMDISSYYSMPRGVYGLKAYYYVSKNRDFDENVWIGKLSSNQVNLGIN